MTILEQIKEDKLNIHTQVFNLKSKTYLRY